MKKKLIITGIRGIPGEHGGFETFAEKIAFELLKRGWTVKVYCQKKSSKKISSSFWKGIHCINIFLPNDGSLSTIIFDFKAIVNSLRFRDHIVLTLGYNTAIFNILYRFFGIKNIINMDGVEWKRKRWSYPIKMWFYLNEKIAKFFSTHMIADHPEIKKHLNSFGLFGKKITVIPYGADSINIKTSNNLLKKNLKKDQYAIVIARPVPENSILEIVKSFTAKDRNIDLLILGDYKSDDTYHKQVLDHANEKVIFAGAIYDKKTLNELRANALFYIHGHTVGGTNPALVEALGAGQAIIAHDNKFNRYVAKSSALYFDSEKSLVNIFDKLINNKKLINKLRINAKIQFLDNYQWDTIIDQYEKLLLKYT